MRRFNPYNNIYYYFRGPNQKNNLFVDEQLEDNTTKALLNTLLNSDITIFSSFLDLLKIKVQIKNKLLYDMQVAHKFGRYDGAIKVGNQLIYFESKVACELSKQQLKSHLKSCGNNYLIVITGNANDITLINSFYRKNIRFITWQQLYNFFSGFVSKPLIGYQNIFIKQFVQYLELINMSEFIGFNQSDFEAFLYVADDPQSLLRRRVKEKFKKYLISLKDSLEKDFEITDLDVDIGNIKKNSTSVWGVICKPPVSQKIHSAHFSFGINADLVSINLHVEGKKPVISLRKRIIVSKKEFLKICRNLEGFSFDILTREYLQPRKFKLHEVARIKLDKNFSMNDLDYIIQKSFSIHLPVFSVRKIYKRDEAILDSNKFINESKRVLNKLKPFYLFAA